jgi:thiol-disulfide isomerase/thioredoxin
MPANFEKETVMERRRLLNSGLLLTGTAAAGSLAAMAGYTQSGRATPAFSEPGGWINTEAPISLSSLRGKVVLVNFWTYSCINSRRPMAYLKRWHTEYGPQGLQVIGIHTPEFRFEYDRANVETYIRAEGIQFPVCQDNDFRIWESFENDAWPGFYLLDRDGRIVLSRLGEDHAREMEEAIRNLLHIPANGPVGRPGDDPDLSRVGSPELYYGAKHPTPQDARQSPRSGEARYSYAQGTSPGFNQYLLDGVWSRQQEPLVQRSAHGRLLLSFSAADLYLVASAPEAATLRIRLDGGAPTTVEVSWPTLYTLVKDASYRPHLVEVESDTPGLALFSSTFG